MKKKSTDFKINVMGVMISVVEIDNMADDTNGLYHHEDLLIEIRKGMTSQRKIQVICHEIGHSIIARTGITGHIDAVIEEVIVDCFASVMVEQLGVSLKTIKKVSDSHK